MANGKIVLPADSVGKAVDTSELLVSGITVERQRSVIADDTDAAGLVKVTNTTPGASDYGLVVRPVGTTPVSGTVAVSNLPATQPVSGTVSVSNFPSTQAVSGPLTDTQLRATPVPVSGTFFQNTQPVSIATMPTTPVTGTFWQATQPVSAASLPLPSGAATETTLSGLNGKVTACNTGAVVVSTLPAIPAGSNVIGSVSLGNSTGKTNVLKTGALTTTATTADQVVLTYTVTAGKTLYLNAIMVQARLTTLSATASILGTWSLETPSGTKCISFDDLNATTSADVPFIVPFVEPIPIATGVVVRIVCTPAAATSMKWQANIIGYEK